MEQPLEPSTSAEAKRDATATQVQSLPVVKEENQDDLFKEKRRVERLSRIRQIVLGSLDGLLVSLGVVSEVAGG